MIDQLLRCFSTRRARVDDYCAGEIDSAAALAAGLGEWLPELEQGCMPSR